MITGFNHTSFTVRDLDRALEFWVGVLGFETASNSPRHGRWQEGVTGVPGAEIRVAHLFGHGAHMELIEYTAGAAPEHPFAPSTPCAGHICLEVDDIDAEWARLMAAGARPQGEVTLVDNGPSAGLKAAYLRDPDGIIIELVEIKHST
jgi:catechol 2,3-dioxygenase-like lactoylglutathione lyase family enzyme